ncbi:hypothetical protein [Hymenobacter sp. DG01]|uniref:hypothetical protein n=1 Tax=Hymenobacter sp. DG01 TaxID=2584940 RepID=UPI00111CE8DB|nr:hypothetical protein [Hymenobacter sp. DG01]
MRASYLLCFVLLILLSGCKKEQSSVPAELLFGQTWYNTFQEDGDEFLVFKREPPTGRGYESFRLEADGQFQEQGIAPADGVEFRPGIWTREDANKYRIRFLDNTWQGYLLEVRLIDKQTLHARRVH